MTGEPAGADFTARLHPAAQAERQERDHRMGAVDFDRAPFTIAWEVTRSCAYACAHCRAEAQPRRDPDELDTEEGMRLIDSLARFGRPILVFTGGDPLMRRDVFDLTRHADERGLRVSLTPTATALPTRRRMKAALAAGVRRVAFSIDGARPETHDAFRGFAGSFERTMSGMANARAEGMPLQVNTTVCANNVAELESLAEQLATWEVVQWSVFFLVPVGRGRMLEMLDAQEHESTLEWLHALAGSAPFDVKATAAPQYRRIVRRNSARTAGAGFRFADGLHRPGMGKGVSDGRGFMFVSHTGEVMPSGFLPLSAGNIRRRDPVEIYRDSQLFRELRDPDALKGKCGRCEFREVCGGSRARAYAVTGDHLAPDPSCPYVPAPAPAP